jgi:hypothetical protein
MLPDHLGEFSDEPALSPYPQAQFGAFFVHAEITLGQCGHDVPSQRLRADIRQHRAAPQRERTVKSGNRGQTFLWGSKNSSAAVTWDLLVGSGLFGAISEHVQIAYLDK